REQEVLIEKLNNQIQQLQYFVNDASEKLKDSSETIRKLQKHLKICQEKLSEKSKMIIFQEELIQENKQKLSNLNKTLAEFSSENQYLIKTIDECSRQHEQDILQLKNNDETITWLKKQLTERKQNVRHDIKNNLDIRYKLVYIVDVQN
ncbi:unnamed protein product, partial [Didymodactylos carnosus]